MSNYQHCTDTIYGQAPAPVAGRTWRHWLGQGLGLLRDDFASLFGLLVTWQKRARTRFELATLDERSLKDAGISRAERDWEVAKPFWRK